MFTGFPEGIPGPSERNGQKEQGQGEGHVSRRQDPPGSSGVAVRTPLGHGKPRPVEMAVRGYPA